MSAKSGRVFLLQMFLVNFPHRIAKLLLCSLLLGISASSLGTSIAIAQQLPEATPTALESTPPVAAFTVEGELNQTSERLADDNSYYAVHEFEGVEGQQVTIDLTSTEFDAYLMLFDPAGNKIAEDDDGSGSSNARIVMTLPITGAYTIIVNTYKAGGIGNYRLSLRATTSEDSAFREAEQPIMQIEELPFAVSNRLDESSNTFPDNASYYELYEFYGESGQQITIELISSEFDAFLFVFNAADKILAEDDDGGEDDNARIIVTLPDAGIYRVMVNTYNSGETGQYRLSLQATTEEDLALLEAERLTQQVVELHDQGKFRDAIPLAQRALEVFERYLEPEHPNVATSLSNLALLYQELEQHEEARRLYMRALDIQEQELGPDHPDVAITLENLASLDYAEGQYTSAEPLFQRALTIREQHPETDPSDLANSFNNLALNYQAQGDFQNAER